MMPNLSTTQSDPPLVVTAGISKRTDETEKKSVYPSLSLSQLCPENEAELTKNQLNTKNYFESF